MRAPQSVSAAPRLQKKAQRQIVTFWCFVCHGSVALSAASLQFFLVTSRTALWSACLRTCNHTRAASYPRLSVSIVVITLSACGAMLAGCTGASRAAGTAAAPVHGQPDLVRTHGLSGEGNIHTSESAERHEGATVSPERLSGAFRTDHRHHEELHRVLDQLDALLHKFVEVPSGLASARARSAEALRPTPTLEESALGAKLHGEVVQRVLEPGLLDALTAYRVAASDAEARGDEEGSREAASALLREIGRARESGTGFGFDHDGSPSRQFGTDTEETSSKYDEDVAEDIKGWSPLLVVCTACVCVVLAGLIVVAVVQVQATATVRHHTGHPEKNARRRRKRGDKAKKPVEPLGAGFRHSHGDSEEYREPNEGTLGGLRRRKPGSDIARDQAVWCAPAGGRFELTREASNPNGTRQVQQPAARGTASDKRGRRKSESTLLGVSSSSSEFSGEERPRAGGLSSTQHGHWETRPGEETGALPVTRRVPHTSPAIAEKQQAYEDECKRLFSRLGELAPAGRSVPCLETEESSKDFLSDEADVQEADEIVTALWQMFDSIEKDFQGNRPAYVTCMIRCCNSLLHLDGLMVLSRCTKKQRLQDKAQKIIETVVPCIWSS